MDQKKKYENSLQTIKGKVIAIVYIFEGEDAPGFEHYHIWKSDVIGLWMNAVQTLHCMPLILDVRTFVEKALANTLPRIDYVINLNCGSCTLSPMSLVPAACAFLGVPCIPCDAATIVTGENKYLSNLVAKGVGLQVPANLPYSDERGIFRPLNLGSSYGVKRGYSKTERREGIYQEFLPGYDITTPVVYNPMEECFNTFPSIIYRPNSENTEWFFGEEEKLKGKGYQREILPDFSSELKRLYIELMNSIGIRTFCRIDARIHTDKAISMRKLSSHQLAPQDIYFVEINPMPTIKENNSFGFSFSKIQPGQDFYPCVEVFFETVETPSFHSFLLSCSMLALQPRTKEKWI